MRVESAGLVMLLVLVANGCGQTNTSPMDADAGGADAEAESDAATDAHLVDCSTDPSVCDDGNACTTDRCDLQAGCVHDVAADGLACDDAHACTDSDVCLAGVCAGTPVAAQERPKVLGTVHGFGAFRDAETRLQGLSAFVDDEHVLFADRLFHGWGGTKLTLARVGPERLEVLDQRVSEMVMEGSIVGGWDWSFRMFAQLIPLGGQKVAHVGTNDIDVYDLGAGTLRLASHNPLPLRVRSVASIGQGRRFWTCNTSEIQTYVLDVDDRVLARDPVALPSAHFCYALALSPDGSTLFVATTKGLVKLDVAGQDRPSLLGVSLAGPMLFNVQTGSGIVAVQQHREIGRVGKVQIFRGLADPPIAEFAEDMTSGSPLGFTLVDGGIVIQWYRRIGKCGVLVPTLYDIDDAGVSLRSELPVTDTACGAEPWFVTASTMSGRGRYAVLQPVRDVLTIDGSRALRRLTAPQHGGFDRLRADDATTIVAFDDHSSHTIDISDPAAPRVTGGGMTFPAQLGTIRLVRSPAQRFAPYLVAPTFDALAQTEPVVGLSRLHETQGGLPVDVGAVDLGGGPAELWSSGGFLYQLLAEGEATFRLRRFRLSALGNDACQPACPDLETVASATPAATQDRVGLELAADPDGSALVVVDERWTVGGTQPQELFAAWFSMHAGQIERIATGTLPARVGVLGMAVAGDRALVVLQDRVYSLRRDGSNVVTDAVLNLAGDPESTAFSRVLAFDGELAYLASGRIPSGDLSIPGVMVLRARDLAVLAQYDMVDIVLSMTTAGRNVVFGMKNAVTVAEPYCPAPR